MTADQIRAANVALQCRAISAIAKSVINDLREISPGSHGFIGMLSDASEHALLIAHSFDIRAGNAPGAEKLEDHKMHRRSFDIRSRQEDDYFGA